MNFTRFTNGKITTASGTEIPCEVVSVEMVDPVKEMSEFFAARGLSLSASSGAAEIFGHMTHKEKCTLAGQLAYRRGIESGLLPEAAMAEAMRIAKIGASE